MNPAVNHEPICEQCPRRCAVDRTAGGAGFCGAPWDFRVARASLHAWEEPCISGNNGSGTVFFSGCNLRCVYCQNRDISHAQKGRLLSADELSRLFFRLRDAGAHNINLVTPTPYIERLAEVLAAVKPQLGIPVVYNCGGYESVAALSRLCGLVDIYLPDFKYHDPALAARYSGAPDYPSVARAAIAEMIRQTGKPQWDENGLLVRGTVVRHLILPGARADSLAVLQALAEDHAPDDFLLSLMNQYTPAFAAAAPFPNLHRNLTTFEYQSVLDAAARLGLSGFSQAPAAASTDFTPDFNAPDLLQEI